MLKREDLHSGVIGYWWTPGAEGRKVPGQLIWNDHDGARLNLLGSLSVDPFDSHKNAIPVTLFGEVSATPISLQNSMSVNVNLKSSQLGTRVNESFHSSRLIIGGHISLTDLGQVTRLEVASAHFSQWQNRSGLRHTVEPAKAGGHHKFAVSGEPLEAVVVHLKDSVRLELRHKISVNFGVTNSSNFGEINSYVFACETGVDFGVLREKAARLGDLVSLAGGHLCGPPATTLSLSSNSAVSNPLIPLDIFEQVQFSETTSEANGAGRWSFRLNEGLEIEDLIRWLDMSERVRAHIKRLLATRYSGGMLLEDKIQNVAAVLQGMGRDISGNDEQKMAPALEAVFHAVDGPLREFIPDASTWKSSLVKSRNRLAHHDTASSDTETNVSMALYLSSFWLAIFGCLQMLEINSGVSSAILISNQTHHETTFSRAILESLH